MKAYFADKERQRALSSWSIGSWGGSGVCSLFGGLVASSLGWRWIFGFTLFSIGLGFYATPSTDAALSNVPNDKAGATSGIYKMASSLGSAFGVAISAALFTALRGGDASLVPYDS